MIAGGPLDGSSPTIKVKDVVQAPNCFPLSWLLPLVNQITAQTNCRSGAPVVESLLNVSRVDASQAPYPYLQRGALASLRQVAASADDSVAPMRVTRALTPFLFQYFYFRRGFLRICGEAIEQGYVGTTAWEQGATVTLDNAEEWAPLFARTLTWTRFGNSFVYDGPDTLDVGRRDVETFQLMSTLFGENVQRKAFIHLLQNSTFAVPEVPLIPSGVFDSSTQLAAEQAPANGMVFGGLCPGSAAREGLEPQATLLLVIALPMVVLAGLLMLLVAVMSALQGAITPFDGGGGSRSDPQLELPEVLYNSVEDTSALSEYALSEGELPSRDGDAATAEASEGIWGDD